MADPIPGDYSGEWYDLFSRHGIPPDKLSPFVDKYNALKAGQPTDLPEPLRRDLQGFAQKWGSYESQLQKQYELEQRAKAPAEPQVAAASGPAPQAQQPSVMTQRPPDAPQPQRPQVVETWANDKQVVDANIDPWAKFSPIQPSGDPWAKFKPVDSQNAPKAEKPIGWSEVPGMALQNAPESALNFGKALVQPILHPIDTAKAIADLAGGLTSKAFRGMGGKMTEEEKAKYEGTANAVGEFISSRYGSAEGFKKALATDPVGVVADISIVLTGGGSVVARGGGLIGQAGQKINQVGRAIDPLTNAVKVVGKTGNAAADLLGVTTGAGARPFKEAYAAGKTGNQTFTDNMRGQRPATDVIDMAENAVGQMGKDRGAAYTANMAAVKANQNPVSLAPVRQSINDAADLVTYQGITKDANAASVVNAMEKKYVEFLALPTQTAESLDALKQAIGEIRQTTEQGTLARKAADTVYNSIKGEIVKQVPEYAKAMKDYSNASDNIAEMRRTMSVSDKAMPDTTMRKLQSTMRNNVNTNYGQREKLLDTLAQYEPNLPPALAGQSLNTWAPRGLARTTPGQVMAGGATFMAPQALAVLPFASPRLMGEAAYAAGRVGRGGQAVQNVLMQYGLSPDILQAMAMGSYGVNALTRQPQQ